MPKPRIKTTRAAPIQVVEFVREEGVERRQLKTSNGPFDYFLTPDGRALLVFGGRLIESHKLWLKGFENQNIFTEELTEQVRIVDVDQTQVVEMLRRGPVQQRQIKTHGQTICYLLLEDQRALMLNNPTFIEPHDAWLGMHERIKYSTEGVVEQVRQQLRYGTPHHVCVDRALARPGRWSPIRRIELELHRTLDQADGLTDDVVAAYVLLVAEIVAAKAVDVQIDAEARAPILIRGTTENVDLARLMADFLASNEHFSSWLEHALPNKET